MGIEYKKYRSDRKNNLDDLRRVIKAETEEEDEDEDGDASDGGDSRWSDDLSEGDVQN